MPDDDERDPAEEAHRQEQESVQAMREELAYYFAKRSGCSQQRARADVDMLTDGQVVREWQRY